MASAGLPVVIFETDIIELFVVGQNVSVKEVVSAAADVVQFLAVLLHSQKFRLFLVSADIASGS